MKTQLEANSQAEEYDQVAETEEVQVAESINEEVKEVGFVQFELQELLIEDSIFEELKEKENVQDQRRAKDVKCK